MESFKDRSKWILFLAGSFLLSVFSTAIYLYAFSGTGNSKDLLPAFHTGLYSGLGLILVSGALSIWSAYHARKEVMIYREKGSEDFSLSGRVLTLSPHNSAPAHEVIMEPAHPAKKYGAPVEVITIYADDKNIRYISPAAETILGYKQIEMIGETDIEKIHPDHRASFSHLFARLKENPDERVKIQYAYKTREGNYIWLESTGSNALADPAINGYMLRSQDITARRLEEQAQRMYGKIQALSENSPDLIIRLEDDTITYINPVIEYYTGKSPVAFLNKKTHETDFHRTILESWEKIVDQAGTSGGTIILEMDFPSNAGKRIMQVHAIPEYDENSELESVLVVSHDITERKKIELEIQYQNKKMTESINYAKRIQTAILPDSGLIHRALPDSFILYKPRDVVSGDFPWYVQVRNDIYMAAVDCTGHGVPGALLSLVGYFLLNDIVRSRRISDPGRILDLLDESVSTTLRPDEISGTKDGMDISLCRINTEQREVLYAGAHRSLYLVQGGELQEIKGNKFPIGGGIFKNQTNFSTHTIKLNSGDSVYFGSDGFCDQFGGPRGRKFGTKQLREIIRKVHTMPMKEAAKIFEDQWQLWKGDQKQTDDVLLMGVKFK